MRTGLAPYSHIDVIIFPYMILFRSSVVSMLFTIKKNDVPYLLIFLC